MKPIKRLQQQAVPVLWNRPMGRNLFHMGLACTGAFDRARPGQFVMVRVPDGAQPLLRRPFSIHRRIPENDPDRGIELLYKVVGSGTRSMARVKAGDRIDLLGPLGNGFTVPADSRRIAIAGGGIGVAPLVFLAETLLSRGLDPAGVAVYLGAGCADELLCAEDFAACGMAVEMTTDDGSAGRQCLVTHPLETAVAQAPPDLICACGPMAMLACVAGISEKYRIPTQVSIETTMACGMGACLGCAVSSPGPGGGYHHACLDGPVFDARNLDLTGGFLR
jgi:dihydroorotate dehydrogenase electron transfer subunit